MKLPIYSYDTTIDIFSEYSNITSNIYSYLSSLSLSNISNIYSTTISTILHTAYITQYTSLDIAAYVLSQLYSGYNIHDILTSLDNIEPSLGS